MKRNLNPWIVTLVTILTFGGLMATIGHRRFESFRQRGLVQDTCHERHYGHPASGELPRNK